MAPPRGAILSVSLLVLAAVPLVSVPPAAQAAGTVEVFLSGLNVPIALAFSPDGRIFYAERNTGQIRIVANRVILATPFYTLPNTATAGERGLLGLALDPGFPTTPYGYAYQTYNDPTDDEGADHEEESHSERCHCHRARADIPHRNFRILPPDPHRFDGDGVGCES